LYRYTMSVGHIKEVVMAPDSEISNENHLANQQPPIHEDQNPIYITLNVKINNWIENHGYIQPSLTIQQLAIELGTNRTYLSAYINSKYSLTFRDWIAKLRIDYAKEMLIKNPNLTIARVAQKVGYSNSSFTAMFIKLHDMSPAQWKRDNIK
ncbi:MAG: helix-turn-helix domain-containing protein, partial [Bacteroides sp.]